MLVRALVRPGSGVDVEQIVAELPDAPDPESVEEGFRRAVHRWPALSAFFAWEGLPTPEKRIAGTGEALVAFPFEFHDFRSLDEEEAEERSRAWLEQNRRRGFRLDRPPLFRVAYFRLAGGARVVWTFHHLLADGRSFEPVLAEALRVGRSTDGSDRKDGEDGVRGEGAVADVDPETLDTDTDPDADADADSDAARSACAFWSEALSGFDGPTPLALANATVETQASAPGEVERRLSSEESRSLERLAADAGVSASTIAAAAWAVVLARTSAEDDVVFGVVGSGRSAADAGRVGLFIRTLPLRTDVPRRGPVLPWLSDLRRRQLGAREHERVSLSDIAGWLGRPGDRPLFETLVVFDREDLSARLARRGGVWTERRFRLIENTGEALTLYATAGDSWTLRLAWDRNRFEERGA